MCHLLFNPVYLLQVPSNNGKLLSFLGMSLMTKRLTQGLLVANFSNKLAGKFCQELETLDFCPSHYISESLAVVSELANKYCLRHTCAIQSLK
jgi:hypothetical protein